MRLVVEAQNTSIKCPSTTTSLVLCVRSGWDIFFKGLALFITLFLLTACSQTLDSPIDGKYTKLDPSPPQWWLCRRCADYRVAGGIWELSFDGGTVDIHYDITDWESTASYTVSDDQLTITDDPYCMEVVGEYTWVLENNELILQLIQDECSFGLRAENLSKQAWLNCATAPDAPGCRDTFSPEETALPQNLFVSVSVYPGDSRHFTVPPDMYAYANNSTMDNIQVIHSPESIPMGINRILWWGGDWIEAKTGENFTAMGVQFLGDPSIGWVRILFDGEEVWRGDTSAIWSEKGRVGGYVEIADFPLGTHTLRVESLNFDYHPVTVASFGFSFENGVRP